MKIKTLSIYIAYLWTKTVIGLAVNPYKIVKESVKRPVLLPVIISPILGIIILLITGKVGSLMIIVYGFQREMVAMILSTVLISILLWQILILYLLISYTAAILKRRN